jgi:hypothetical protein
MVNRRFASVRHPIPNGSARASECGTVLHGPRSGAPEHDRRSRNPKEHDADGEVMGWFRETQVEKLIAASEARKAGKMSASAFDQIVQSSTERELDEAIPGERYDE